MSYRYNLVDIEREEKSAGTGALYKTTACYLLLVCVLSTAFFAGRYSIIRAVNPETTQELRLDTLLQTFEYNRTFGEPPSNVSDEAWRSVFPSHGGFFKHPRLAPERSAFSVYHQLHCLNSLRIGVWSVYNEHNKHSTMELEHEHESGFMMSPSHLRHCIDLLRQSIMCRPDLTVEKKNEELGGVTGFGTEHQCKNWEQLQLWTSQWENFEPV
ncbi:uncharacterized protein EAF02_010272 [Botrytis sinoallii]|uniref:uncharacterized protein n=1 Tax=Botrytis sinoallii TaxID=1463999 RepID=UPI0019021817|nr:uncharacterized protein EAF02_010272 [Botrytis sinoallii]KAF7864304.1 hypothetical protein EAF02_010272 [Botrytis sinoallii]